MITLTDLVRRVHKSNPRITRIYLPDDEYDAIMAEARAASHEFSDKDVFGFERRVAPAWAPCYRLSEIPDHLAAEAEMRA